MQKLIDSNKIQVDYDFSGSSNFLIISVQNGKEIVNYQVQMLSNNQTQNFLQVRKVQINNAAQLYYDITNKATLSQILKNEKVTKPLMFKLIDSILGAMMEAEEYQLEDQGIVLDKKYIYMDSAKAKPVFVFLPFYRDSLGIKIIGDFLLDLKRDNVLDSECDKDAKTIVEAAYSSDAGLEKISRLVAKLDAASQSFSKKTDNIDVNGANEKINKTFGLDKDIYENPFDSVRNSNKQKESDEFFDYFKLNDNETYGPNFKDELDVSQDTYGINEVYSNSFNKIGANDFFDFSDEPLEKDKKEIPDPAANGFAESNFSKDIFAFEKKEKKASTSEKKDLLINLDKPKVSEEDALRELREQIFNANTNERKEAQMKKIQEQYGESFKKNQDPYGDKLGKNDSQINLVTSLKPESKKQSSPFHKIDDDEERQALERMKQIENMAKTSIQPSSNDISDDTEFIDMESDFIKKRELEYASLLSGKNSKNSRNPKAFKKQEELETIMRPAEYEDDDMDYVEQPIPKKNLILFGVGVLAIFVAIVLCIMFGAFEKPEGGIHIVNVAIVVLAVCVALFILYSILLAPKEIDNDYSKNEIYDDNINKQSMKQKKPRKDDFSSNIRPGKEISTKQPTQKIPKKITKDKDMTDDLDDTVFVSEKNTPYLTTEVDGVVQKIFLNKPVFALGRFVGKVDFVCQSNKVGKVHAEIINRDGIFFVNDIESKNGTYINSYKNRLKPHIDYPLDEGDVVILADVEFTIHF